MQGTKEQHFRRAGSLGHHSHHPVNEHLIHTHIGMHSGYLKRRVRVDIFRPQKHHENLPLLLLNDGQDSKLLQLERIITERYQDPDQTNILVAAIHAGDRIHEYGVAGIPDYMNRGNKAGEHEAFVTHELLPFLRSTYHASTAPEFTAYAGFSLGGLSALDAVWRHPHLFSRAGVFSGSLWWRQKGLHEDYHDSDRIMHARIAPGPYKKGLRFWFEAGTNDETADRNNNGIIDAIDDTLDLIETLKSVGYSDNEITYLQVEGGEHNFNTWSEVFPEFLSWAFDKA